MRRRFVSLARARVGLRLAPSSLATVVAVIVIAGCYPNPDALRAPSSGAGGTTSAIGGTTGGAGSSGMGGHTGAGGMTGAGGQVGVGGNTGGVGGGAGYVGTGLALTPDATGWIAPTSNALGLMGHWYAFSDGVGANGATSGGACEMAGHPASACSMLTSPSPTTAGFPNTGGKMCAVGVAALVVDSLSTGLPDFGAIYGASIGFDFNYLDSTMTKGTFNALANAITGISFDIDTVPTNGLRVEFVTPGTDYGFGGPAYWGANAGYPSSPVVAGTNRIYWADAIAPYGLGLDPTQLVSMYFSVPTQADSADSFHLCISNVTLIRDTNPTGHSCSNQTFPVYCPAQNGVPGTCWGAGVNCNTVVSCSGVYKACPGQAQNEYFSCATNACVSCSDPSPIACPALGTVPATCWTAGTVCSTITNCGGQYRSCSDPAQVFNCTTLTCL